MSRTLSPAKSPHRKPASTPLEEAAMSHTNTHKLMSNAFDKLHETLSAVRGHVETLEDPTAEKLFQAMEFGLLAPMRKLRLHLDIPYDWHEQRSDSEEASQ